MIRPFPAVKRLCRRSCRGTAAEKMLETLGFLRFRKESVCPDARGMVHRGVFYNISHNVIPRSGGFVTRKATIAVLAVLAIAAGAMLPRTFETAPPAAAQAQNGSGRAQAPAGYPRTRLAQGGA